MTIFAPSYEEKIAILVGQHLIEGEKDDLAPLLSVLGCSHLDGDTSFEQPPACEELLVTNTLLHALHWYCDVQGHMVDGVLILDGLLRGQRWKSCLTSTRGAICLTIVLLEFFNGRDSDGYFSYAKGLRSRMLPGVLSLLNEWLRPVVPLKEPSSVDVLLPSLFGAAWCTIHLTDDSDLWNARLMILNHQPPFVPGLLPAHLTPCAQMLPDLGSA